MAEEEAEKDLALVEAVVATVAGECTVQGEATEWQTLEPAQTLQCA
jgi:predicted neutral ceramidase superfamily lipid hydrolase